MIGGLNRRRCDTKSSRRDVISLTRQIAWMAAVSVAQTAAPSSNSAYRVAQIHRQILANGASHE
jgi:hypothetical protein